VSIPQHIAIIMDGNGRWAESRGLARHSGHKEGVRPVRMCIEECAKRGVGALTLFAFSSEIDDLHKNKVRLRFIGDRHALSVKLQARMAAGEELTAANPGLKVQVAVSYGGRWDIVQAARRLAAQVASGALSIDSIDETRFGRELQLGDVPDPDLFIRTGGDHRISNFLLWNLAYTELHVCETLWPDFGVPDFENALVAFAGRERRFGLTRAQAQEASRRA
jgi:undecaprenyl diphosphate synthase